MRWLAGGLALIAVVAILFVGLKVGGELHYGNCLKRVELEYPASFTTTRQGQFGETEPGGFEFFRRQEREAALSDCHGWP